MIKDIVVIVCCIASMLIIAIGASLMFHEEPQDVGEPVPILNVTNDKHTCYIPEDMREGL